MNSGACISSAPAALARSKSRISVTRVMTGGSTRGGGGGGAGADDVVADLLDAIIGRPDIAVLLGEGISPDRVRPGGQWVARPRRLRAGDRSSAGHDAKGEVQRGA